MKKQLIWLLSVIVALLVIGLGVWFAKSGNLADNERSAFSQHRAGGGDSHGQSASFAAPKPVSEPRPASTPLEAARSPREWQSAGAFQDARGYIMLKHGQGTPAYDGPVVQAFVEPSHAKDKFSLEVNQLGEFPRVYVDANERVKVRVEFPESARDTPIAVTAEDGGRLDTGGPSGAYKLDDQHGIDFEYTSSSNTGIHRVAVMTQTGTVNILDFWVGDEHVLGRGK